MKVALDVSQTCVQVAGCGWIAHQLAKALSNLASPQQEIILYHHFGYWINSHTENGFQSQSSSVISPLLHTSAQNAKELWDSINQSTALLPGEPDIVHSHNFSAPNTGKIPLVYTVHDLAFWDIPRASTETNRLLCQDGILKALVNAKAFVFPSQFTRTRFLDLFADILDRNKQITKVIPWAGRFEQAKLGKRFSPDSPWLFVGSLDPRKNVRNLLQAFERYWERSNYKRTLLIAGPSGWKTDFESSHIKSLTRRGWAKHLGYLGDSDLKKYYQNAFALVWPSYYEGFGLPVVEAMTQATPVITSNRTSLSEVGGGAAIYCNPDSVESICNAMLALETSEDQYKALSEDSLQQSKKFSWERAACELLDFYKSVLSLQA
jgi:glycosyltransferase involved in cell wall biosynthesis